MRAHEFGRRRLQAPNPAKLGHLPLSSPLRAKAVLYGVLIAMFMGLVGLGNLLQLEDRFREVGSYSSSQQLPAAEYLDFEREPPSVANLPRVRFGLSPAVLYKAQDASGTTWTGEVGEVLSEYSTGSSPDYDQGAPTMGTDTSVQYGGAGNKWHRGTSTTGYTTNMSTDDIAIRLVFKNSGTAGRICGALKSAGGARGWQIYNYGSSVQFTMYDEDGNIGINTGAVAESGVWYMIDWYLSRSTTQYGRAYTNIDLAGSALDISGRSKSISQSSVPFEIGAAAGAATGSDAVAFLGVWHGPAMLTTHLQGDEHEAGFRALTGFRPQTSAAGRDTAPLTYARNTNATLSKYNETTGEDDQFTVGPGWLRVEKWKDSGGRIRIGYRSELAATNLSANSRAFDSWATGGSPTVTADAAVAPDGHQTADRLSATGTDYIQQTVPGLTPANDVAVGLWMKRVSTTGTVTIRNIASTGNGRWTVDLSALPDRWVRLTAGSPYVSVLTAWSVAGTGQAGMRILPAGATIDLWQGQVEDGYLEASSDIATTSGSVARAKDELEYSIAGCGLGVQGAIVYDMVQANADLPAASYMVDVSDGGATNRALHYQIASNDTGRALVGATSAASTTALSDGAAHRCGVTWGGSVAHWLDGVHQASTALPSSPGAMNQVAIGQAFSGAGQPSLPTLISRVKLYATEQQDMSTLTGGLA
jgi:hypothetical protein